MSTLQQIDAHELIRRRPEMFLPYQSVSSAGVALAIQVLSTSKARVECRWFM